MYINSSDRRTYEAMTKAIHKSLQIPQRAENNSKKRQVVAHAPRATS